MEDRTRQELIFDVPGDTKLAMALVRRLLARFCGLLGLALSMVLVVLVQAKVVAATDALGYLAVAVCPTAYMVAFELPKQIVQRNAHKLGRPVAYRIDHVGIHRAAGFMTDTLPWPTITKVTRTRGQIILWQGWRTASAVPSGGLSPAEQDRLLEVLRSRGRALTTGAPAAAASDHRG